MELELGSSSLWAGSEAAAAVAAFGSVSMASSRSLTTTRAHETRMTLLHNPESRIYTPALTKGAHAQTNGA